MTQTVSVATTHDTKVEENEDFKFGVTAAQNAQLDPPGLRITWKYGYVRNNDVDIMMQDLDVPEWAGTATVKLTAPGVDTARDNGLIVQLVGNTANGTAENGAAVNGKDYIAETNHLTNVVSPTHQTAVIIDIHHNLAIEGAETLSYRVTVGAATSATVNLLNDTSLITIKD